MRAGYSGGFFPEGCLRVLDTRTNSKTTIAAKSTKAKTGKAFAISNPQFSGCPEDAPAAAGAAAA